MYKSKFILFCFIFIASFSKIFAQDPLKIAEDNDSKKDTKIYIIKSMNGSDRKVHIMPDYWGRCLKISCLNDTLTYHEFWGGLSEVRILNKCFIQIKYDVRGGSNLALGNLMILCIRDKKLCEAIHILRYSSWDSFEKMGYSVKLSLHTNKHKKFTLYADVHDKAVYDDPEKNYDYRDHSILGFDDKLDVFYSIKNEVDNTFDIYDSKDQKTHKQEIVENLHQIILGSETYYLLKDGWYELQRKNILQKYSFDRNK